MNAYTQGYDDCENMLRAVRLDIVRRLAENLTGQYGVGFKTALGVHVERQAI